MKKLLIVAFTAIGVMAQAQTGFLTQPSLSPDGATVYFCFESDIWKASSAGGAATRITAMPGFEQNPRLSPDGKWLAFNNNQYGNHDVYVMPAAGGEIRQLTYHSGADIVSSWGWDSKKIYFTSARLTASPVSFTVPVDGGTPQRVFGNYFFSFDHLVVEHPASGELFFNNTWESLSQAYRKRYKGPFNPDIQSYNPVTKVYKQYTSYEGKDFYTTIDNKGNLYFLSDENTGEYNLFTIANGEKKALTKFNTSARTPQVNAQGGKVVFEKDYSIWLYNVATEKAGKIDISITRNNVLTKDQDYDVKGKITAFDVSPDGKKLVFVSRGELFVSDLEGKYVSQVKKGNAERADEVLWLADNKTILYNQTVGGYYNLFTIPADGSGQPKAIAPASEDCRSITLNKKRTQALYIKGGKGLYLLDTKTLQSKLLVTDEFWALRSTNPYFSPNDEWVVYAAFRNFERDVFVYNIKNNQSTNLTKTGVTEADPVWSPDGKYIYFAHNKTKPSYPTGNAEPHIYRLPLEKWDEPYKLDKFNSLFSEEPKKDTTKKKDSTIAITINTSGNLMERIELISPLFGSQGEPFVTQKAGKTTVLYNSDHGEGKDALWKTVLEPFMLAKTEKITEVGTYGIIEVDGKLYGLNNGSIVKIDAEAKKADPIPVGFTFRKNLQAEFRQIFEEAWARMEVNFYDAAFHGIDWKKKKEQYEAYLPAINNRNDLSLLLNEMLGELNSSHTGFSSFGDDIKPPFTNQTAEPGLLWDETNPYKVTRIISRGPADKKDVDIKPGDILQQVNGETVNTAIDRNKYFTQPSADKELELTFLRDGKQIKTKLHPQTNITGNLYDEWMDANQQKVDKKSNNRIAYHHMKDMGAGELEAFLTDMTQELPEKDALILDIRYNRGGNVHDEVLRFLSQRTYLKWKYRGGALAPQSNFGPADKPIVLLINEQSLSDAEMTATGFKALKLGTIIGNETYRWIIFTSGAQMVDGSAVRLPSWGCYSMDGKDIEVTGVQPDIKVLNSWEDKINGLDPQLDKAVEEIMKKLK